MALHHRPIDSFSPNNQLSINCPVFKAQSKIAQCFDLRDMKWRGERIEQRQGCQVAMTHGKCPAAAAVSRIIRSGEDPYFAAQSRVVNFHSAELEAVAKVIVPDSALNGAPLSEAEVRALRIANDKARTGKTREGAGAELADVQRRSKKMPTAGPSPQSEDEPRSTWTYPKGTWRPAPDLRQHDRAEIPAFLKREAPEGGWKKGQEIAPIGSGKKSEPEIDVVAAAMSGDFSAAITAAASAPMDPLANEIMNEMPFQKGDGKPKSLLEIAQQQAKEQK